MAGPAGMFDTPRQRPVWPLVMVGIAVVLLVCVVGAYFYLRDSLVPQVRRQEGGRLSLHNLRTMSQILAERSLRKGWPPFTGKRFVLSLVADRVIDVNEPSNLELFFSPADPDRGSDRVPPERWSQVTRKALGAGLDVDALTSYAGPAAPITMPVHGPVPIMADLHFEDGALIGYASGAAEWLERDELGLAPDDPIVAGPSSKSPILRQLSDE